MTSPCDSVSAKQNVHIVERRDEVTWSFEKRGKYTTESLYRFMTNGGVSDPLMMSLWKYRVALKIQIFMWIAFKDRIHSKTQFRRGIERVRGSANFAGKRKQRITFCSAVPGLFPSILWVFTKETLGYGVKGVKGADACVNGSPKDSLSHRRDAATFCSFIFCSFIFW